MGRGKTCQRKSRTSLNFQVYVGFDTLPLFHLRAYLHSESLKTKKKKIKLVAPKPVTQT